MASIWQCPYCDFSTEMTGDGRYNGREAHENNPHHESYTTVEKSRALVGQHGFEVITVADLMMTLSAYPGDAEVRIDREGWHGSPRDICVYENTGKRSGAVRTQVIIE